MSARTRNPLDNEKKIFSYIHSYIEARIELIKKRYVYT